jgi:acyl-CoA synthetase (AMP-forming)/AMP-acid ligase II
MYGQTEATARLAYLPPSQLRKRPGAIGKAIPGVDLQVQNASGGQLPPGHVGELCARGPNVMLGYWNAAAATASALSGGWLRTGDLACADDDGFLFFQGRKTSEVKIRGLRVDLAAVTDALSARFPESRLVVVPFQAGHTKRLALFLAGIESSLESVERIREICRVTLARHEVPAYIEIVDRFSLNDALKIDFTALAQRASEQYESPRFTAVTTCGEMPNMGTEVGT